VTARPLPRCWPKTSASSEARAACGANSKFLDQLATEEPFEAEIEDFEAMELAADAVLVTYKVTLRRKGAESASSLRSSIWLKREGRWRILFHQGTATNRSWSDYLKSGVVASEEFVEEA